MQRSRHTLAMAGSKAAHAVILGCVALGFAPASVAAGPTEPPEIPDVASVGAPLGDPELATIRGKFIRPDSISYFGISMLTSWQDESGVTTVARLVFNVDFLNRANGNPVPQLMIGWVREGDPAMDVTDSHAGYTPFVTPQQVVPLAQLGTTQGAAQANLVAGADNVTRNMMQITLVPTSQIVAFEEAGLTPIDATTAFSFADGDRLEFQLGNNEIGLVLTGSNGGDSALQSVGGEFGRMLQQTMINSDGNTVLNNSAIIMGADMSASRFDAVRATEAIATLRGLGF